MAANRHTHNFRKCSHASVGLASIASVRLASIASVGLAQARLNK